MIFLESDRGATLRLINWTKRGCIIALIYHLIYLVYGFQTVKMHFGFFQKYHRTSSLIYTCTSALFALGIFVIALASILTAIRFYKVINLSRPGDDDMRSSLVPDATYCLTRLFKINVIMGVLSIIHIVYIYSMPMLLAWATRYF